VNTPEVSSKQLIHRVYRVCVKGAMTSIKQRAWLALRVPNGRIFGLGSGFAWLD
jgi:hypothetical protein